MKEEKKITDFIFYNVKLMSKPYFGDYFEDDHMKISTAQHCYTLP